jgi:hypothetical protein
MAPYTFQHFLNLAQDNQQGDPTSLLETDKTYAWNQIDIFQVTIVVILGILTIAIITVLILQECTSYLDCSRPDNPGHSTNTRDKPPSYRQAMEMDTEPPTYQEAMVMAANHPTLYPNNEA